MPAPRRSDVLVVCALRQEAAYLRDIDVVFTGPGKLSAALAVAAAIVEHRPSRVINVGTAGALREGLEGTHSVGTVLEHDFDHDGLVALLGEPLPGPIVLDDSSPITLATGDQFVQGGPLRDALAARADLVDMEGYAVARACGSFAVPCELVKIVSDEATEHALRTWQERLDHSARLIAAAVEARLR